MKIATSKTREKYPLSPKKIIKKTLVSSFGWLFFFFFVSLIGLLVVVNLPNIKGLYLPLALLIICPLVAIVLVTYLYQRWYWAVYFYDLTDDFVVIRKGPITPREITIPYERLQDTYVDQDILDRIFGIYDVHFSSATIASGMEAHIDGLEKPAADGLRNLVLDTINKKIGRRHEPKSTENV